MIRPGVSSTQEGEARLFAASTAGNARAPGAREGFLSSAVAAAGQARYVMSSIRHISNAFTLAAAHPRFDFAAVNPYYPRDFRRSRASWTRMR